jgi:hypothetical protein
MHWKKPSLGPAYPFPLQALQPPGHRVFRHVRASYSFPFSKSGALLYEILDRRSGSITPFRPLPAGPRKVVHVPLTAAEANGRAPIWIWPVPGAGVAYICIMYVCAEVICASSRVSGTEEEKKLERNLPAARSPSTHTHTHPDIPCPRQHHFTIGRPRPTTSFAFTRRGRL